MAWNKSKTTIVIGAAVLFAVGTVVVAFRLSGAPRKFVRIVLTGDQMTFEGQPVSWANIGTLLEAVPDREHTVLEWAVNSDHISAQQRNDWMLRCGQLARQHGFEYASFIGVHPLGSKGGDKNTADAPVENQPLKRER